MIGLVWSAITGAPSRSASRTHASASARPIPRRRAAGSTTSMRDDRPLEAEELRLLAPRADVHHRPEHRASAGSAADRRAVRHSVLTGVGGVGGGDEEFARAVARSAMRAPTRAASPSQSSYAVRYSAKAASATRFTAAASAARNGRIAYGA
jgi:hypothetical protein